MSAKSVRISSNSKTEKKDSKNYPVTPFKPEENESKSKFKKMNFDIFRRNKSKSEEKWNLSTLLKSTLPVAAKEVANDTKTEEGLFKKFRKRWKSRKFSWKERCWHWDNGTVAGLDTQPFTTLISGRWFSINFAGKQEAKSNSKMMLLSRLTGKKPQNNQPAEEQTKEDDPYSGFGVDEVAAPLQTDDLEYDEGFQVNFIKNLHFYLC